MTGMEAYILQALKLQAATVVDRFKAHTEGNEKFWQTVEKCHELSPEFDEHVLPVLRAVVEETMSAWGIGVQGDLNLVCPHCGTQTTFPRGGSNGTV